METSTFQTIKLAIVAATGLSKDALHVHVGLLVFVVAAWLSRRRSPGLWPPWLAVVLVAALGELMDLRDDIASIGHWRWAASLHDVVNTCLWPTLALVLHRCGPGSRFLPPR